MEEKYLLCTSSRGKEKRERKEKAKVEKGNERSEIRPGEKEMKEEKIREGEGGDSAVQLKNKKEKIMN